jgi:hypothetical protein
MKKLLLIALICCHQITSPVFNCGDYTIQSIVLPLVSSVVAVSLSLCFRDIPSHQKLRIFYSITAFSLSVMSWSRISTGCTTDRMAMELGPLDISFQDSGERYDGQYEYLMRDLQAIIALLKQNCTQA